MLLTCWYSQPGLLWDLTNMPFYTITNLQGSQTTTLSMDELKKFYTITNLQGSQTFLSAEIICSLFYTITNLQGSQTLIYETFFK